MILQIIGTLFAVIFIALFAFAVIYAFLIIMMMVEASRMSKLEDEYHHDE